MTSYQSLSSSALRRIQRDYKELAASKTTLFGAAPVNDDLRICHATLYPRDGPYTGTAFHLELRFPADYPNSPPDVKNLTPITGHPNMFGNHLCLDMLRKREYDDTTHYSAWSTAYSLESILLQLYSFFFNEHVPQDYGGYRQLDQSRSSVQDTIQRCNEFVCPTRGCNHSGKQPYPTCPAAIDDAAVKAQDKIEEKKSAPEPVILYSEDRDVQYTNDVTNNVFACQTFKSAWSTALCVGGITEGVAWFEAQMSWQGGQWSSSDVGGAVCRIGLGTAQSTEVGTKGQESMGYGSTGKFSYNDNFKDCEPFVVGDKIVCLVDRDHGIAIFYRNGKRVEPHIELPDCMFKPGVALYPMVTFKNCRVTFNWSPVLSPRDRYGEDDLRTLAKPWNVGLSVTKTPSAREASARPVNVPRDFHTKADLDEVLASSAVESKSDDNCLGMGIEVTFVTSGREGKLQIANTKLVPDLISWEAFTSGVRRGVWGETFTQFLPVMINAKHAVKAAAKAAQLFRILSAPSAPAGTGKDQGVAPFVLDVLSSLMNNVAVSLCKDKDTSSVRLFMSEKALGGYCQLFHVLLYMCLGYPDILKLAREHVDLFCTKPDYRRKFGGTRDLGKLLICVCLGDIDVKLGKKASESRFGSRWPIMANAFVEELLARNVSWAVQNDPSLTNPALDSKARVQRSFKASITGFRNVMLQLTFLASVHNMTKDCGGRLDAIIERFDKAYGLPDDETQKQMHEQCQAVLRVDGFRGFYQTIGLTAPIETDMYVRLQQSFRNAEAFGYYRPARGGRPDVTRGGRGQEYKRAY